MIFVWFRNGDDCDTFPKMGYCLNVESNVVHVYEVSDGYAIVPVKLLFVLFEMVNCTCEMVSRIFSVGKLYYGAPQEVWLVFGINFFKMLFPGVCFLFMYLFV